MSSELDKNMKKVSRMASWLSTISIIVILSAILLVISLVVHFPTTVSAIVLIIFFVFLSTYYFLDNKMDTEIEKGLKLMKKERN